MQEISPSSFSSNPDLFCGFSPDFAPTSSDHAALSFWPRIPQAGVVGYYSGSLWADEHSFCQPLVNFDSTVTSQVPALIDSWGDITQPSGNHSTHGCLDGASDRSFQEHDFQKCLRSESCDWYGQDVSTDFNLFLSCQHNTIHFCGIEFPSNESLGLFSRGVNSGSMNELDNTAEYDTHRGETRAKNISHPPQGLSVHCAAIECTQETIPDESRSAASLTQPERSSFSDRSYQENVIKLNESSSQADLARCLWPGNWKDTGVESSTSTKPSTRMTSMVRPVPKESDQLSSGLKVYAHSCQKTSSETIVMKHTKARRYRPLSKAKAQRAAKTRLNRSKCILCHLRKVPVSHG